MLQRCVYTPSYDALVKCLLKTRVPCPNDSRRRARIEVRSVKNDGCDLLALSTRYRKPCAKNKATTLLNITQKPLPEITPCLWEPLHILPPQREFPVIWLENHHVSYETVDSCSNSSMRFIERCELMKTCVHWVQKLIQRITNRTTRTTRSTNTKIYWT